MRVINRFTITFAAMTSLGIAPLVAQTPSLQTVPLSADIDVVSVRILPDGNTLRQERKMKFYRRADGSTRVEEPNRVVIVDNSSHTVTVLDTAGKVAQVQNAPLSAANGTKPAAALSRTEPSGISLSGSINIGKTGAGKSGSGKTDLGVKVIAGYSVHGIQQSTTIAANSALGNTAPITKMIEVWRSADLRLPLLTVITDPLGGTTTSQYENISTATPPDSSLFTVPAGYRTVPAPQSRVITSQTN
jgi:hypothetical protein